MAKKQPKQSKINLLDSQLAEIRMRAITVAAGLPEAEPGGGGMMSTSYTRPGKSADKVVADAEKIIAFVTRLV
jgi:hypothetical protein